MAKGEIMEITKELRELIAVRGVPVYSKVIRWEKAIPQYHLGHLSVVEQFQRFEERNSGIFLTGNYRGGISVGDCVMSSQSVADRVLSFIRNSKIFSEVQSSLNI